jgi:hypothetical protein
MVYQKERESHPQMVGLAILVVVFTVHFGVGSVLAIAAAAVQHMLRHTADTAAVGFGARRVQTQN